MPTLCFVLALAAVGAVLESALHARPAVSLPVVEIANDDRPRDEIVLSAQLPPGLGGETFQLRDDQGVVVPVQMMKDRRVAFVLSRLAPWERRTLVLEPALDRRDKTRAVEAVKKAGQVDLVLGGKLVFTYRGEKTALPSPDVKPIFQRGGYIHPVLTPEGRLVTDDYPPDHLHHHGIWFAWTNTEFQGRKPDFWNMGDGTGTVEFESLLDTWSGAVNGGFKARHRYVDLSAPTPVTALTDTWEVTLHALGSGAPKYRVFDLVSTHDLASSSPLVLPEYRYGGIGVRGHRTWLGETGTVFLTSEGKTRKDGHGTRARWCHIGGTVDGKPVGIAVLDHPSNFRHPQAMRIHPTEPFFNFAPMQLGRMELVPGKPYVSKYRFVVYDGQPDKALIDRLWHDFAAPPKVEVR
jgi:Methane oxygenase PmoA